LNARTAKKHSLRVLAADTPPEKMIAALRRHGAVLIRGAVPADMAEAVARELRPYFDSEGHKQQSDFDGFTTLRLSGVLAKSRSAADLIAHPLVLKLADDILLPYCSSYRLGSASAIEIWPGEKAQRLHRDDTIYPMRINGVEWQISALWALSEFTPENGATRLVPGSHQMTEADLEALIEGKSWDPATVAQAVMKKGDLLVYLGRTYHGGGANTADKPRIGLVNTYALGWLRIEENHYLAVPRAIAESYPEPVQRLLGYATHSQMLGWYPEIPRHMDRDGMPLAEIGAEGVEATP
jgi:ectoine hydroxylase-related dioxygenase (phytanoyl-CoA dioxygenase family)